MIRQNINKLKNTISKVETKSKINNLVSILDYKYSTGDSLKEIYDETIKIYGNHGKALFMEFALQNKNNKDFMDEFHKTSFIENIKNRDFKDD